MCVRTKTMRLKEDSKDSLYTQLGDKFLEAKQNGNLVFDQTCCSAIDDVTTGMELWLSYAPSFLKKPERGDTPKDEDPLGKYEPELLVSNSIDTTDHLRLVLNKFAIVPNHSLLVTNEFEDQQSHLTREELLTCYEFLRDLEKTNRRKRIVIYNCGPQSGSSQRHKHLQLLEIPEGFTPFQYKLCQQEIGNNDLYHGVRTDTHLPFAHFVIPLDTNPNLDLHTETAGDAASTVMDKLWRHYSILLERTLKFFGTGSDEIYSYNFIMTTEWLCMIPRRNMMASSLKIGFNSIGYVGMVLCKDRDHFTQLRANPELVVKLLTECGFPLKAGK